MGGLQVPWGHILNPHGDPHQPHLAFLRLQQVPSQLRGFVHALLSSENALPYRFSSLQVRAQRSLPEWGLSACTLGLTALLCGCYHSCANSWFVWSPSEACLLWEWGTMKAGPVILFACVWPWRMLLEGPLEIETVEWVYGSWLFPYRTPSLPARPWPPTGTHTPPWVSSVTSLVQGPTPQQLRALSRVTGGDGMAGLGRDCLMPQLPSQRGTAPPFPLLKVTRVWT